ncbi:MAG: Cupin 2 conserved barrel domain protein [Deltaproteobacteria bacterium]|nr:Cupin 2 conserved barrel domain protein [Deltaproteobacteria bacterium]
MDGGFRWSEIAWEKVNESIDRKVVMGERLMMVMYRFSPNQSWPEEVHEAEQAGYVLQGKIELSLPAQGKKTLLGAGEGYLIPSRTPHAWRVLEETLLIDFFSPPRRELFRKKFAPNSKEG